MKAILWAALILSFAMTNVSANGGSGDDNVPSKSYYINKSENYVRSLVNKLRDVKLGQNWKNIEKILGTPDVERESIPKKSNVSKGTARTYYVLKVSEDLVNEKLDRYIRLLFDENGILIDVKSNIDAADEIRKGE